MKKIMTFLSSLLIILGLTGCSKQGAISSVSATGTKVLLGMIGDQASASCNFTFTITLNSDEYDGKSLHNVINYHEGRRYGSTIYNGNVTVSGTSYTISFSKTIEWQGGEIVKGNEKDYKIYVSYNGEEIGQYGFNASLQDIRDW